MISYKERLANIDTIVFDVDGVFTDNSILLMPDGDFLRTMSTRDGYAVKLAVKQGFRIAVISGGKSEVVKKRFMDLGVSDVFLGIDSKMEVFSKYLIDNRISLSTCMYVGDDIPDYEAMEKVYLAACPADAVPEIKQISHYISPIEGGKGCVRDILEQLLKVKGKWFDTRIAAN